MDREPALEQAERRRHRHPSGSRGPGRGSLRSREDQGSDPRIPRGQEAPPGAWKAGRRRGPRADPLLRRAAGRRQDQPRPEHRARSGPAFHPDVSGRRARRGGDPRPSPHLHRRAAGPHHPGAAARGDPRSGLHARRDRQARRRLARRPVLRAAGGARSRSEPHVRRQLPRRALRPVAGAVHRDGQHARHDPRVLARSDGDR